VSLPLDEKKDEYKLACTCIGEFDIWALTYLTKRKEIECNVILLLTVVTFMVIDEVVIADTYRDKANYWLGDSTSNPVKAWKCFTTPVINDNPEIVVT